MNYVVAAYFTENTAYEKEAQGLIESLKKFNLPMDVVGVASQGDWQANAQYKAYFVKQMLIRHFPKDILYVDADAKVRQHPALFDSVDFDVGIAFRENIEMLGGTLYFANKPNVLEVVERWVRGCHLNPQIWDQQVLQHVLKESIQELRLKICTLPPTYCQIFDLMKHVGEPVIEHFQASRRFKQAINEKAKKQF